MLKQAKFINKSDKEEEKMAEEYNVQAVMNELREKEEMDPDRHDGCYELMRETVKSYSKLQDFSVLDYNDLNLVYLTTVGTWKQGVEGKKKNVEEKTLGEIKKEKLERINKSPVVPALYAWNLMHIASVLSGILICITID